MRLLRSLSFSCTPTHTHQRQQRQQHNSCYLGKLDQCVLAHLFKVITLELFRLLQSGNPIPQRKKKKKKSTTQSINQGGTEDAALPLSRPPPPSRLPPSPLRRRRRRRCPAGPRRHQPPSRRPPPPRGQPLSCSWAPCVACKTLPGQKQSVKCVRQKQADKTREFFMP